jgi:hypothetical protein
MKNTTYLLNFLLSLALISCSQKDPKNTKAMLRTDEEIIEFQIDDQTPNVSMGMQYFDGFLFNINWAYNQIQIYNLSEKRLVKNLDFEIEGDQGVGELFGFHVHSLDSIFLFSQMDPFIYLTDTSGIVSQKIRYQIPDGYSSAFVHPSYFLSPPVIQSNEMIVKTHFAGNYREVKNEDLKQKQMVYAINLTSGETRFLNHTYPADYLEKGLKHFETSMAISKDKVVYSLFGDHRLFYADSFENKLSSKDAASSYLDTNLKLFPLEGVRFDTQKYLQASSRYESLVYDPFRDVFYRFAYPTLEVTDENEVLRLRIAPGPFVIMVLDNDLNVIGETYLEKGKYLPSNFFINEDGLYLSINHPDNPENEEGYFKFQRFSLEYLSE